MIFEIKSRLDASVIFSLETESLKLCIEAAIKRGADLQGADLQGADLQDAYLRGADLRGADLQGADLRGAYLRGADLQGAYLQGADLQGADLRGAYLQGADLQGAKGLEKFPIQILAHRHFIQTTQDGNLRIGCEEHSFYEWREITERLGSENGYSALDVEIYKLHIEHIERISKLLWNKQEEKTSA